MALGDLSPDQARYVDLVASATGLARPVVVAWVGAESGWGINKAGHNYLNIGPGRTYPSTAQAAAAAAALINASSHYVGIRAAIPAGGGAQIQAIGASPWGTSATLLNEVYRQLTSGGGGAKASTVGFDLPDLPDLPGSLPNLPNLPKLPSLPGLPSPGDVGEAVGEAAGDAASAVVGALLPILIEAAMSTVFTVAAFAFIAMGVFRLTGTSPKDIFQTVAGATGTAGSVAKLAAV